MAPVWDGKRGVAAFGNSLRGFRMWTITDGLFEGNESDFPSVKIMGEIFLKISLGKGGEPLGQD